LIVFTDPDACIDYITNHQQEKVFFIVSSSVGEQIVPLIDQIDEIDSIYVYCPNEVECAALWGQFYRKVCGIFVDIDSICEQLNKNARQCSNTLISMSSIPSSSVLTNSVNREQVSLMYSQLIRDLFLVLKHPTDQPHHALRDMILHFTIQYKGYDHGKALLEEIERDYYSVLSGKANTVPQYKSIWWYTRCSFIFETLNKALRTQDIDMLYKMRFFIVDLYKQLEELYSTASVSATSVTVYRGQAMSSAEFEKHKLNINGLLSISNFLSTSTDRNVAESFAFASMGQPGIEAVLFEIEIDPKIGKRCPFASIEHLSYFRTEYEVLISMGSVFRIHSVERDTDGILNMYLKLTGEEDEELEMLADDIWKKIRSENDLLSLAKLMRLMGNFEKAEMFLDILMNESTFCDDMQNLALIINEIGLIHEESGDLTIANSYYQKFIEIKQKRQLISSNDSHISSTGGVRCRTILEYVEDIQNTHTDKIYEQQENDREALQMYEEKLRLFSPNDSSAIEIYSIIALLHARQGEWQLAQEYVEKTLKESVRFRFNHSTIAESYERIGLIYEIQERYIDAVNIYEKVLTFLSDDDANQDMVLSNIGHVYEIQSNYEASLEIYMRLLKFQLDILCRDHPRLSDTYASIARSFDSQHRYEEAYVNLTKALNIDRITMSSKHPWIKQRQAEIDVIRKKMVVEAVF
jgi:tetratricopeptide (TPR) repeat protein